MKLLTLSAVVKPLSYILTAIGSAALATVILSLIFEKRLPKEETIGSILVDMTEDQESPELFLSVYQDKFDILKKNAKATFDVKLVKSRKKQSP